MTLLIIMSAFLLTFGATELKRSIDKE